MSSLTPAGAAPLPAPPTGRRRELLDAAVGVVADEGLRGLTHRAVDRRAGLPEGTCSAYLRTRQALQVGVAGYVAARLARDVEGLRAELADCGPDASLALVAGLFERWLAEREVVAARLELGMEATRNPAVAEELAAWRARLVAVVEELLADKPAGRDVARAETLVAALDGVLLGAQLKPAAERASYLSGALALLLPALTGE